MPIAHRRDARRPRAATAPLPVGERCPLARGRAGAGCRRRVEVRQPGPASLGRPRLASCTRCRGSDLRQKMPKPVDLSVLGLRPHNDLMLTRSLSTRVRIWRFWHCSSATRVALPTEGDIGAGSRRHGEWVSLNRGRSTERQDLSRMLSGNSDPNAATCSAARSRASRPRRQMRRRLLRRRLLASARPSPATCAGSHVAQGVAP